MAAALARRSRSLLVSEHPALIVHCKRVTLHVTHRSAPALPLHGELCALSRVGGFDLATNIAFRRHREDYLAAASAVALDGEDARFDGRGRSFVGFDE